jgi:hypothetical protein
MRGQIDKAMKKMTEARKYAEKIMRVEKEQICGQLASMFMELGFLIGHTWERRVSMDGGLMFRLKFGGTSELGDTVDEFIVLWQQIGSVMAERLPLVKGVSARMKLADSQAGIGCFLLDVESAEVTEFLQETYGFSFVEGPKHCAGCSEDVPANEEMFKVDVTVSKDGVVGSVSQEFCKSCVRDSTNLGWFAKKALDEWTYTEEKGLPFVDSAVTLKN